MQERFKALLKICVMLIFCSASRIAFAQQSVIALAQTSATYSNPAIPGDHPDPSIIRVGRDYWATATTSEWGPEFPLLHSRDLVNWETVGAVFKHRPLWSTGNYWAPEISEYRGRFYVYYVAHKKEGSLCVAVATANKPSGPYTDHGALVCQEDGSIDPVPVTDENGARYLVWKEDGNSRNQPTPIWAQQLSADGTKLVGEKRELIRNDAAWEANLVEGPFVLRRNGYFYLFYSGNACCGRECNYALGVARSKTLLGKWEKNPSNPILTSNSDWKCPGHGSIVEDASGRAYLLYHAYQAKDFVYVGRQALLDEVKWTKDDWATINDGKGPSGNAPAPLGVAKRNTEIAFFDDFSESRLRPDWQYPQNNEPVARIERRKLVLQPNAETNAANIAAAVLARYTTTGDYTATAHIQPQSPDAVSQEDELIGLAAYGDDENALGIARDGLGNVFVWRREKNNYQEAAKIISPNISQFRMVARGGNKYRFAVSDDGKKWTDVGDELDGSFLPPWDRGVRVALTVGGRTTGSTKNAIGRFYSVRLTPTLQTSTAKSN